MPTSERPRSRPDRAHKLPAVVSVPLGHRPAARTGWQAADFGAEVSAMSRLEEIDPTTSNGVALCGRVVAVPLEHELPSGARIVTLRLSVPRARTPMTAGSRQRFDWVDCVAWSARSRRTVAALRPGDTVTVEGALRRRFYRTPAGAGTRLEVEAVRVRRERR